MKKKVVLLIALLFVGLILVDKTGNEVIAKTDASDGGYTGSIDDIRTCSTNGGCHSGGASTVTMITSDIPAEGYLPYHTYTITVTVTSPNIVKFGFEATCEDDFGTQIGTMTALPGVQIISSGPGQGHATHTSTSVSGSGSRSWDFEWTSSWPGVGDVTFYGSTCATNDANNTGGDITFRGSMTVHEDPDVAVEEHGNLIDLRTYPNPVNEVLHIELETSSSADATLELFDLQGRLVKILHSGNVSLGREDMCFSVSDLPAGFHLLKLTFEGHVYTRKLVLR